MPASFSLSRTRRLVLPAIVFLVVNLLALLILRVLNGLLLARSDVTVGARAGFLAINMCLTVLELPCLTIGELTRLHTLFRCAAVD